MVTDSLQTTDVRFPHHTFADDETGGCYEFVGSDTAKAISAPSVSDVGDAPELLRRAGVTRIILVHGTFAGNDIVGITREIARVSPRLGGHLSELGKSWFDELIGEVGNYTESFADCFSSLINSSPLVPIPVERFHWSGENLHLGRANGMMFLLESMLSHADDSGGRILIFAHSHGGNVLSMLSELLGASVAERRSFFDATRLHYRIPLLDRIDLPVWQRIKERLLDENEPPLPPIDVATFGTPLRYRWNIEVCPNLLHFVQHRPLIAEQPEKAALPTSIQDVMHAAGGDYIQQLGIAGTDFLPSILSWRDWIVERRMGRMFEPHVRRRDVIKKLKLGRRASREGTTLLVDYGETEAGWNRKIFGHGVYTCRQWLPFHLREISDRFYR